MRNFVAKQGSKLHILRLDRGDDLLGCLNALIQKEHIQNGAVISGIGTFDHCVLHMVMTTTLPPVEHFEKWDDKPLELSSVDGIIANGVPHLHALVSDHEKAYSGHVEPGCRILYLGELLIMEFEVEGLYRVKNADGINELTINS
ncbi:MAG: DNA-binding protein [Clostridiales bacterium]|jgi:predicted DNA-binding protein with PD1-like motif|nr:DNA-binding protein [Clostridiales bacterium]